METQNNSKSRTRKVVKAVALLFLFVFGTIGAVFGSVAVHELSHRSDFKDIAQAEETCFVAMPQGGLGSIFSGELGYYKFSYSSANSQKVDDISKYTELKAYSYNFLVFAIFITCSLIVLLREF